MVRCHKRPLGWVFVSRMIGVLTLLIVIVLANILLYYVRNPVYHSGVAFVNENFWLVLLIAIILFAGDIFRAFPFPLNLPFPVIRAIGSVFVVAFLLKVFQWTDGVTGTSLYPLFWYLSFLIVPLVFILVLAGGYFEILRQLWWQPKIEAESEGQVVHQVPPEYAGIPVSDAKTWEEIGAEFRMMLYDIIHRFRQEIKRK